MYMLRIEHAVPSYDGWKKAFDSDPVGREKLGVRRYQILRATDNPGYVFIDLEFDTAEAAQALLSAMQQIWKKVEGPVMTSPKSQIVEILEKKKY
ncbi:MAG: hypothetical protein ACWGOV_05280 [Acidiferrobacterales bacterium]